MPSATDLHSEFHMTSVTEDATGIAPDTEPVPVEPAHEITSQPIAPEGRHTANDGNYGETQQGENLSQQPVFLALQGGGAKGIVHIGGIAALEELDFDIKAVSGTSAGSMVAALISAGYTSKDLVDPEKKKHFFNNELFGKGKGQLPYNKPTDLFTGIGWFSIRSAMLAIKLMKVFSPFPGKSSWANAFNWVWRIATLVFAVWITCITWPAPKWPLIVCAGLATVIGAWALYGLTTVERVRHFIDAAIAHKVKQKLPYKTKNITFQDMHNAGCIPLKIIATNKTTESLEFFCLSRTPRVAVADAVAASICLPIVFRHWNFKFRRHSPFANKLIRGKFLDGGLVSNLPAWAFDEERLTHSDATTVAFSLETEEPTDKMHWLLSIVNTVVNGSGEIHTRASGSTATVALPTTLDLLDFDVSAAKVYEEVETAKVRAVKEVGNELIHAPNALSKGAKDIHEIIERMLTDKAASFGPKVAGKISKFRVRIALGAQIGHSSSNVTFLFDHGFHADDPDRYVTVPLKDSFAGNAWGNKKTYATGAPLNVPHMQNAWPLMQWMACIPVYPQNVDCRANRSGIQMTSRNQKKIRPCIIKIDCDIAIRDSRQAIDNFIDFLTDVQRAVHDYANEVGFADYVQGQNKWK